jgi:glycerate kinase
MRFAGARLVSGFDLISDVLGLERKIAEADLVITGEGSLDSQTLCGKGPAGVAAMARAAGTPVIAVAGRIEPEAGALFDAALSLQSFGLPKEESIARASELVRRIVAENGTAVRQAAFSRNGGKSR